MEVKVIKLTPHQEDIKSIIDEQLLQSRRRIVLTGSAGVGKTTLVNFLIGDYIRKNKRVYVTAPTHKALSVLEKKIAYPESDNLVFNTVHKGLKLRMRVNEKTGNKEFHQVFYKNDKPFKGCRLLVIDEASMLSPFLLEKLEQYDFPIIFIGDEKQVNPVKELHSPVFHQHWFTVELTEIIRQGDGNPIIDLSRNLPLIKTKKDELVHNGDTRIGYLHTNNRDKIIFKLAEVNGTDDLKYIAWTNEEVDSINYSVRSKIYGNPNLLEVGESVILNASYVVSDEEILNNNQELRIETLEIIERPFFCENTSFDYKVYLINGRIYAMHEDFLFQHKKNVRIMKSMAIANSISWKSFYNFSEQFLNFKYNHAITVHKSQGSTYKHTIVNIEDIEKNFRKEEKTRLLYTAVTRASELLILYNA